MLGLLVVAIWILRVNQSGTELIRFWFADPFAYFLPMYAAVDSSQDWGAVLWNAYDGFGTPALAMLQGGYLYPPHLLYRWIPAAEYMQVMAVSHLVLAGWFTAIWCRAFGAGRLASLVAALVFICNYALSQIYWGSWLEPIAWIPLGLYAIEKYSHDRKLSYIALLAVAIAMALLAGGSQSAVYGMLALGSYAFFVLVAGAGQRAPSATLMMGATLLGAVALGLLLSAPQLLPSYEAYQMSARPRGGLEFDQLFPYGTMHPGLLALLRQFVSAPESFDAGYIGPIPLALAAVALLSRRWHVLLFSLVLVGWGVASILRPDWYVVVLSKLPVLSSFRFPERTIVLFYFGLAAATALGTDRILGGSSAKPGRVDHMGSALFVVVLSAASYLLYPQQHWWQPVAMGAVLLAVRYADMKAALAVLILVSSTYDLVRERKNKYALPWTRLAQEQRVSYEYLQQQVGFARILPVGTMRYNASAGWHAKIGSLNGLYTTSTYDPFAPKLAGDYLSYAATGQPLPKKRIWPYTGKLEFEQEAAILRDRRQFLSLMSVRYYLLHTTRDQQLIEDLLAAGLARRGEFGGDRAGLVLLEDANARPRSYGVYSNRCAQDSQSALALLQDLEADQSVVISGTACSELRDEGDAQPPLVRIVSHRATEVVIEAEMAQDGYVVLTDAYYPGWVVTVNGERSEILQTNVLGRSVAVPGGKHLIKFEYRPHSLVAGVGLGLAGLVVLLWLFKHDRNRPSGRAPDKA